jgi:thimet oligopeptidase
MTARMPSVITTQDRTTIPILTPREVMESASAALAAARERVAAIEAIPLERVSPENVLEAWDRAAIVLEDAFGPISLLNSVAPDQQVRDAGDTALVEESDFMTTLFQSEKFYERVRAVQPRTAAQKQLQKDLVEAFEDSGVALPPEKRERFRVISSRITELGQEFAKNIRENATRLRFSPAECEGLPQSYLERVPRDGEGNIVVGFDYPDYVPFMMNARHEGARRRYYIANQNRGTARNLEVLDEIVALRREIAGLYGAPSYAHYVTRRRMVENPETVDRFLDEVRDVVAEAEVRDLGELAAVRAAMTGEPVEQARIERWDVSFYRERLREQRYAIDQEELRRYFPTMPTIEWMLEISERLYQIRFEQASVPVWDEEVL